MAKNHALFLDRDGVINVEQGYVHRREDFRFQPGIFDLCRAAQSLGYLIVVVTNQAGIGRGYYSESAFLELTAWMVERFAEQRVEIARVYYCPYHPFDGVGQYRYDSPDRKPKPGMILRAQIDFDLDLTASVLIGDKTSDIQAGTAAGIGTNILLAPIATAAPPRRDRDCHTSDSLDDVLRRFFAHAERGDAEGPQGMFLRPCKPFCVGES